MSTLVVQNLSLGVGGLPNGSVTTDDIADSAITTAKLAAGAVVTADIANAAVTAAKLDGAQSGSAPIYGARAWVNFNGTGTVSIRASGNVSSVTDNGTGTYVINFATALPDANYVALGGGAGGDESVFVYLNADVPSPYSTTQFECKMQDTNDVVTRDTSYVWMAFFR